MKWTFLICIGLFFPVIQPTALQNHEANILRVGVAYEPNPIIPWENGWENNFIVSAIYSPLYKLDREGNLVPELADGQPQEIGGELQVRLKENLKFSDGTPLNASDVAFTYRMMLLPAIRSRYYYDLVPILTSNESISVVDDRTIRFVPKSFGFVDRVILEVPIISKTVYEDDYDACLNGHCTHYQFDDNPIIGSGAFSLGDVVDENILVLNKNEGYWNARNIMYDQIEMVKLTSTDEVISSFTEGSIDIVSPDWFFGDVLTGINFTRVNGTNVVAFFINHNHPYFGTGELIPDNGSLIVSTEDIIQARFVRKAMDYVINRTLVSEVNFEGMAMPTEIVIPYSAYGRTRTDFRHYSVTEAKRMMEFAGFNYSILGEPDENGKYSHFFFNITILAPTTCPARNFFHRLFGEELMKIGIGITAYHETGWNEIASRSFAYGNNSVPIYDEGGYDLLPLGYSTNRYSNILEEFYSGNMFTEIAEQTFTGYRNGTFNKYFEDLRQATTKEGFMAEIQQIENLMYEDLPILAIVVNMDGIAISNKTHVDPEFAVYGNINWTDTYSKIKKAPMSSESTQESSYNSHTIGETSSKTSDVSLQFWTLILPTVIFLERKRWARLFLED